MLPVLFLCAASYASSLRPHTNRAEGLTRFLCGGSRANAFPSCSKFFLFPLAQNKRMPPTSLSAHKWQMLQAVLQVLQALLQVLQATRVLQRWHRDSSTLHTHTHTHKHTHTHAPPPFQTLFLQGLQTLFSSGNDCGQPPSFGAQPPNSSRTGCVAGVAGHANECLDAHGRGAHLGTGQAPLVRRPE